MKTEEENMLYIKKYSGFIISIVIGLLLYEEANYAYTYRAATAYSAFIYGYCIIYPCLFHEKTIKTF